MTSFELTLTNPHVSPLSKDHWKTYKCVKAEVLPGGYVLYSTVDDPDVTYQAPLSQMDSLREITSS